MAGWGDSPRLGTGLDQTISYGNAPGRALAIAHHGLPRANSR